MIQLQEMEQEKTLLRWGALAGVLGGTLFILALFVVIAGPVGMEEPADLVAKVIRFPDIKTARVVENLIYLSALMLEIPLFLAIYHALRRTSLSFALFGCVLGIAGIVTMMVSSTPHVAHAPLSALFHAPSAAPADQATVSIIWQAIWGIVDMTTYVGFFVVSSAITVIGAGIITSPAFGKSFGWVILLLGAGSLVMAILQMVDPASMAGLGCFLAGIIFYFVMGWKLFDNTRTS